MRSYDAVDLAILAALADDPRATVAALAQALRMSRNTIHARLVQLEKAGAFLDFDRCVDPHYLGHSLTAFLEVEVRQKELARIVAELRQIPEVVQAFGRSGTADLRVQLVCRDTDHLFRIDAAILAIDGVERTETSLAMGELIPYRLRPLMEKARREL
ncbi:transcriptional regulator, AsnC family [Xylanimonas cellulosilytica DSM 15894]|uniref:Transcriptional regulator, AsnC family n=1 Tax=Xylanimonas cellulosilytica (strain DSM 15894 / JCM 12276 / CECT 5975 / KCTC 9989 / LMG 20990 / NBRC 107835 / XIL07) TaxID=446471 RepID=D1BUA1_XYLCX|nr:Lrp/AsnC family transcriptional regulator [Xylanimonas cellulosilytica]ACZ31114.1 transcriptional regulator, AsnC family [Xylanimonas cellulosilytica DSM 15894]